MGPSEARRSADARLKSVEGRVNICRFISFMNAPGMRGREMSSTITMSIRPSSIDASGQTGMPPPMHWPLPQQAISARCGLSPSAVISRNALAL